MKPGTQIIYIPTHAEGDENHPDAQAGFVTSVKIGIAFCRYWSKHSPGELRTKANSEGTPLTLLIEKDTVPQDVVDELVGLLYIYELRTQ